MQYLSFIGEVQEATGARGQRVASALAELTRQVANGQKNWSQGWARELCDWAEPRLWKIQDVLSRLPVLLDREANNIRLTAYDLGSGRALLVSHPIYGDWREAEVIVWPPITGGPAQVAGACCNPHNMLHDSTA